MQINLLSGSGGKELDGKNVVNHCKTMDGRRYKVQLSEDRMVLAPAILKPEWYVAAQSHDAIIEVRKEEGNMDLVTVQGVDGLIAASSFR